MTADNQKNSSKILIAGCGKLGCPLGEQLSQQGHDVYGIRRNIDQIPTCITPIKLDLTQSTSEALPDSFDYVYYILSAAARDDYSYYQAYVQGVKHLLELLKKQSQPPKHLFFVSSSSVFGQTDTEVVTEESPVSDRSFSAKRLLEGEALINDADIPSTIIRFGGIYGPGRTHLINLVSEGKARCLNGVYSNRIHSQDCIGMLAHLLTVEQPAPLYIGVDSAPTLTCEVYEWLAEQLSVTELEYIEPTENARAMRSNKRLSNAKILETGYQLHYPDYQTGYKELLNDFLVHEQSKT